MSHVQRNSLQSLHRTHSFINRTPHTVVNIVGRNTCKDIIKKLEHSITKNNYDKSNKNIMINHSSNVRCIRIDQCQIQNKQDFLEVPPIIVHSLFNNLIKLAITKCNLQSMNITQQSLQNKKLNIRKQSQLMFPNLQQLDVSQNKLPSIPLFIFKCQKLKKICINNNNLTRLDTQLKQLQNLKFIGIFLNNIQYLSVNVLVWARQSGLKIDYQWKIDFLMISIDRILDNQKKAQIQRTQGEEIEVAAQEQSGQYSHKYRDQIGDYIDIKQLLNYLIEKIKPKTDDSMKQNLQQQYFQLLSHEHIEYLRFLQPYIIQKGHNLIMKFIQNCLKERYYKSMDYLLTLIQKINKESVSFNNLFVAQARNMRFNVQNQKNMNLNIKQKQQYCVQIKEFQQLQKQNMIIVGKKKIKMLNNKNSTKYKDRNKIVSLQSPTSSYQLINKSNLTERSYKSTMLSGKSSLKQNNKINLKQMMRQKQIIKVKTKVQGSQIPNTQYQSDQLGDDQIVPSIQDPINSLDNSPIMVKFRNQTCLEDQSYLVMAKLVSYNISHIQSISLNLLLDVNLHQFTWFLNQLQYVYKYHVKTKIIPSKNNFYTSTSYLRSIFKSKAIKKIANNLIINQNTLEYILNSVSYKLSIKLLLTESNLQYLLNYEFSSSSIIKGILLLDDHQLFSFFARSYKNFVDTLFGNTYVKILQHNMINMVSITNTVIVNNEQAPIKSQINKKYLRWQQVVRPQSKLYKILYKKQKQYIKNYLKQNNSKNWHFPQYVPPQTFIVRNDAYDYQILKDYQQFQSIYQRKDLKLQVRSNFNNKEKSNHFSIAKKIYMDVVQQINGLVRNIGKSKKKSRNKSSHNNTIRSDAYIAESFLNSNKKIKTSGSVSTNLLPNNITENKLSNISITINTDLNKTMKPSLSKSIQQIQFFAKTFSNTKKQQQNKQNLCFKKESHQIQKKKGSVLIMSHKKKERVQSKVIADQQIKSIGMKSKKKKGILIMCNSSDKSHPKSQCLSRSHIELTPYQKILKQNKKQLQLTQKRTIYLDLNSNSNKPKLKLSNVGDKVDSKNGCMEAFHISLQEEQFQNSQQVQCSTFDV